MLFYNAWRDRTEKVKEEKDGRYVNILKRAHENTALMGGIKRVNIGRVKKIGMLYNTFRDKQTQTTPSSSLQLIRFELHSFSK